MLITLATFVHVEGRLYSGSCGGEYLECNDGSKCIHYEDYCNGFQSCPDNSDESDCDDEGQMGSLEYLQTRWGMIFGGIALAVILVICLRVCCFKHRVKPRDRIPVTSTMEMTTPVLERVVTRSQKQVTLASNANGTYGITITGASTSAEADAHGSGLLIAEVDSRQVQVVDGDPSLLREGMQILAVNGRPCAGNLIGSALGLFTDAGDHVTLRLHSNGGLWTAWQGVASAGVVVPRKGAFAPVDTAAVEPRSDGDNSRTPERVSVGNWMHRADGASDGAARVDLTMDEWNALGPDDKPHLYFPVQDQKVFDALFTVKAEEEPI